ncbi:TIGR02099 family protein [Alteromonas pelagimontana]|uniref:TIGR02099 family protein n=1 Tax=Alteromonas pelagimontana TaxID=1858656 RepID=A0A6M4MDM9_9ALTE|nr:YhdP family protein [Alteromonas pelagimontana]QJR81294.1 TIGR02099 family protein [Alteromonas pelagimontana]
MTKVMNAAAWLVRKAGWLLAVLLVVFAVMLSVLRYALPHIDHKKYMLEDYVNTKYGVNLSIDSVQASWQSAGPTIVLNQVSLTQNASSPVALTIDRVYMELDFWQSLSQRLISSNQFTLVGLKLNIDADRLDSAGDSDFPVVDALKRLFLEQLQRFSLEKGELAITQAGVQQSFELESLSWVNRNDRHQGQGAIRMQELTNNSASFVLDLQGDKDNLNGVFYARAEELDISPWVSKWIKTKRSLSESRANFEIWAEIEESEISALYAQFHESKLTWGGADNPLIQTGIRGGSIQALPKGGGWNFRVDQLVFDSNDQSLVTDLVGYWDPRGDILVNTVKPAPVNPFLVLLPLFTDDTADDDVKDFDPKGQLATLQLQVKNHGAALAAKLIDVSWEQQQLVPGLDALDMDIYWYKNQGVISVSAHDANLEIDNLLSQNFTLNRLRGDVYLFRQAGGEETAPGWVIQSDNIRLESPVLGLSQAFRYSINDASLSLLTQIDDRPVEDIELLLPAPLMGETTKAYLSKAFVGQGEIKNANVLWHGRPADFPFADNSGVFQAQLAIEEGSFKFADDWPALTDLDLNLYFQNDALVMESPAAKLMNVDIKELSATIPQLKASSVLTIYATGESSGDSLTELMTHSGIASSLGVVLDEQVKIEGDLSSRLKLHIPLQGSQVVATGDAVLKNNKVFISSVGMTFADTSGTINFTNEKISGSNLQTRLLNQPVTINLDGKNTGKGYSVGIGLQGDWNVAPLLAQFNPAFNDYLTGNAGWNADVELTLPEEGFSYKATIASSLKNVASMLPIPFNKVENTEMPLLINGSGNAQASNISATLGKDIRFDGVLPHKEMQFSRAHLALGSSDFVGMGIGFSVSADLPVVNVTDWYKTIELMLGGFDNDASASKSLFSVPERIFVNTNNLVVAGQTLSNVNVTTKQNNNNWMLEINSAEARATVNLYDQWLQRGIEIEADYIRFDKFETAGTATDHKWNADKLPPVYFHCLQCTLFDKDLGEVTLDVARAPDGMHIRQLQTSGKYGRFDATGHWLFEGEKNTTHLEGNLASQDVGMMLQTWGINSGIKDSAAALQFNVDWPESPMDISLQTVAGNIQWSLTDGYLSELSDKGSRILTIFSLNSLIRKLSLDFRDVFAKGFFYDDMHGTLQIADGRAKTRDTEIDGGAGEIVIKGYTDLVSKELNYNVVFTPNVTGNLPFLVYFLATPPTALAALALDQMLTSAKVISNVNYRVTGTLDNPRFDELGRDSKDITLPAQNIPLGQEQDRSLTEQDLKRFKLEVKDG